MQIVGLHQGGQFYDLGSGGSSGGSGGSSGGSGGSGGGGKVARQRRVGQKVKVQRGGASKSKEKDARPKKLSCHASFAL